MKKIFLFLIIFFVGLTVSARTIYDFDYQFNETKNAILSLDIQYDGDVIHLIDGTVVEGVIVEQTDTMLKVQTASGKIVSINYDQIQRIDSDITVGDYSYTITSQMGNPLVVAPQVVLPVAPVNNGKTITQASEFNGPVFPHFVLVRAKDHPQEAAKSWLMRQDHYVADGVDFNGAEFQKFIEAYCPLASRHHRKARVNICIGSGLLLLDSALILANVAFGYGIIDVIVASIFYGCGIYHMKQEYSTYEEIYAGKPFYGKASSELPMRVEQPVYEIGINMPME